MPLEIKKVESPTDLKQFIRLPHKIYQGDSPWVPPLEFERKHFLNPKSNPFFEHAEVDLYLAADASGDIVGRLAVIQDDAHNKFHSERTGFFGMFEAVNDPAVSNALLDTAMQWCQKRTLHKLVGPMNLSTNHECGLLIDNFEDPPAWGIPYNPPYYENLLEQWGLKKARDLISFTIDVTGIPEYLQRAVSLIQKKNRFTIRTMRMERFQQEIELAWEIYNSAWVRNWGFVPMDHKEFTTAAAEMKHIVDPSLCFFAEAQGQTVGFVLTLPDINQVLKKMNGRLFPLGWLQFLLGRKNINRYRVITLGVKKEFQRLGIDAFFFYKTYQRCLEKKIPVVDMSWVLEDNQLMASPIERVGGVPYKRHRIYERTLSH